MATIISHGTKITIQDYTLSSTDDIQVGFAEPVNAIIIQARTAVDIQVRESRGISDYYTIKSGDVLTLQLRGQVKDGAVQPTNVWLRSASGTPVAEIIGLYGG